MFQRHLQVFFQLYYVCERERTTKNLHFSDITKP